MQIVPLYRTIIGILLIAGSTFHSWAQNDDVTVTYHQAPNAVKDTSMFSLKRDDILKKIAVGGTLGLQVGTYTYIELAPDVSYHFNKWVAVGVGGTYIFAYDNYYKQPSHIFGARVFTEGHFFNYLGLHVAYQALNYDDFRSKIVTRIWSNNLSLGGGYYQRVDRFSLYFYLLYNISDQRDYNVYGNMLVKAGFNIFLK
ncbi:MAG: hypothetical protein LBE13_01415 [Bacteroidales bacterium]|jgi:hypothetical protein|nr:hypothetical protein [Bacteroidales bacterium]